MIKYNNGDYIALKFQKSNLILVTTFVFCILIVFVHMMHISWLQAECSFLKAQIATVSNTQQKIRNIGSGYSISNQKIKKDIESLKLENKSLRERIKHLRR